MDREAQKAIQQAVGPAETVQWAGRPRQGFFLRPRDGLLIPVSLLLGGFAIFGGYNALTNGTLFAFAIIGALMVAAGLYLIVGRFVHDAWARRKTVYGITRDRAVILSGIMEPVLKSFDLATLGEVHLVEHGRQGEGTIHLGRAPDQDIMGAFGGSRFSPLNGENRNRTGRLIGPDGGGPAFDCIADAKWVFDTLQSALDQARAD